LKARLEIAESRNEEIAASVPETTRPLLRQIEALQSSNSERLRVWEELEKSLTSRLREAEDRAQEYIERERQALAQLNETVTQVCSNRSSNNSFFKQLRNKSIQSELISLRNNLSHLTAEMEAEKIRHEEREREVEQLNSKLASTTTVYDKAAQEWKSKETVLQTDLNESKQREEQLTKQLQTLEKKLAEHDNNSGASKPQPVAPISPNPTVRLPTKSEFLPGVPFSSSFGSFPPMEKIQAFYKQKEGEILSLQTQNSTLEKAKGG
jgi:DNA repair exonuclease SbcCD ATPase subunit